MQLRAWVLPLPRALHWTAALVDFSSKQVIFVDLLCSKQPNVVARAWTLVEVVSHALRGEAFDFTGWACGSLGDLAPEQPDYFNCGIFPILLARCLHHGVRITRRWTREDLDEQRDLITLELLEGKLLSFTA